MKTLLITLLLISPVYAGGNHNDDITVNVYNETIEIIIETIVVDNTRDINAAAALGMAFDHNFDRFTYDLQWSCTTSWHESSNAASCALAKRLRKSGALIDVGFGAADNGTNGGNINISGKF